MQRDYALSAAAVTTTATTDEVSIRNIVRGDKRAMRVPFARHNVRVHRFIARLLEGRSQVSTWLLAIVRYKALSQLRSRANDHLDDETAQAKPGEAKTMEAGELGRVLEPGETLFRQGDLGDCMFVILEGRVEIVIDQDGWPIKIAELAAGECFGEMALFERKVRMATVRAGERTRVLTVDRKNLLRRCHDDPSLGYRLIQTLSQRLRRNNNEFVRLKRKSGHRPSPAPSRPVPPSSVAVG